MKALRRESPLARLLGSWAFWLLLLALSLARVVEVEGGGQRAYLVLLPFQEIRVEFLNSVTGRPVLLEFRPLFRFQAFIPFYANAFVLGHQWNRVCRLRVSGSWARTRHRSATTSIISSRS